MTAHVMQGVPKHRRAKRKHVNSHLALCVTCWSQCCMPDSCTATNSCYTSNKTPACQRCKAPDKMAKPSCTSSVRQSSSAANTGLPASLQGCCTWRLVHTLQQCGASAAQHTSAEHSPKPEVLRAGRQRQHTGPPTHHACNVHVHCCTCTPINKKGDASHSTANGRRPRYMNPTKSQGRVLQGCSRSTCRAGHAALAD